MNKKVIKKVVFLVVSLTLVFTFSSLNANVEKVVVGNNEPVFELYSEGLTSCFGLEFELAADLARYVIANASCENFEEAMALAAQIMGREPIAIASSSFNLQNLSAKEAELFLEHVQAKERILIAHGFDGRAMNAEVSPFGGDAAAIPASHFGLEYFDFATYEEAMDFFTEFAGREGELLYRFSAGNASVRAVECCGWGFYDHFNHQIWGPTVGYCFVVTTTTLLRCRNCFSSFVVDISHVGFAHSFVFIPDIVPGAPPVWGCRECGFVLESID